MGKRLDNATGLVALSENEMRSVQGGGWIDVAVDLFISGLKYFYQMGYEEARAYRRTR